MLKAEEARGAAAEKVQAAIDRGFHPAQTVTDMMATATNVAPQGVWLTGLAVERGKTLTLRGTATNGDGVTNYQRSLVDEERFRDVKLVVVNNTEIENTPVVQFSFSAFPVGNLPLTDPDAKKGGAKK
jgi:Tfp pilus assembly protein PilN